MKRIYLALLFVIITGSAYAQANLQLTNYIGSWQGTNKMLMTENSSSDNPVPDTIWYSVKNLGPNDLGAGDTLRFLSYRTNSGHYYALDATKTLKNGETRNIYYTTNVRPASTQGSETKVVQWCDSVWATRSGSVITDADATNNKSCANVTVTYWANSVNDVDLSANVMTVYPNPAHDVISVKFNFGTNAKSALAVRDILGKVIYQRNLGNNLAGEKEFSIDASNFAAGLYFVELTANETKKVTKVTVQ